MLFERCKVHHTCIRVVILKCPASVDDISTQNICEHWRVSLNISLLNFFLIVKLVQVWKRFMSSHNFIHSRPYSEEIDWGPNPYINRPRMRKADLINNRGSWRVETASIKC